MPRPSIVYSKRLQAFLDSQHDIGESRKVEYRIAVGSFERFLQQPFETVYLDTDIVHAVLNKLDNGGVAFGVNYEAIEDSTWNNYLGCYKRFARWLSDPDDENYPKLWKKIKRKKIDWEEKLKGKWLSEEEFFQIIDVIDSPRDKAMFAVAVSGALRACELLGLKLGNVEVSGFEIRVTVSGKTGTRSFVMNQFSPLLKHWLNFHPLKREPNAPLWVRRQKGANSGSSFFVGLQYCRANNLFKRYARLAGIKKPVSLHWIKHTKITWAARNRKIRINDKQANAVFGWSPTSNMFRRYTHLHGTDTDDTYRALEGIEVKPEEAKLPSVLQPHKCLNCGEMNGPDALYCLKCGVPLGEQEASRVMSLERAARTKMEALEMRLAKLEQEKKNEK